MPARFQGPLFLTCMAVAIATAGTATAAGRRHRAPKKTTPAPDGSATSAPQESTPPAAPDAGSGTDHASGSTATPRRTEHVSDEAAHGEGDAHGAVEVRTAPSTPVEPERADGAAPAPAPPPDTTTGRRPAGLTSRSLIDAEIGGDAAGRNFSYHDGLSNNLRAYTVAPAAMIGGKVELFPFADASGVLRDIGLVGAYARSLMLQSTLSGGILVHTVESAYSAGVRVRIHPWGDDGAVIGVVDEYAGQSFLFDAVGGGVDAQLPAVNYSSNRTAVDGRLPFGRVSLMASFGFRAVFDAGAVASRFRGHSANGIDAGVGAAFAFARGFEARALVDYERYFYSFAPVPGDLYVAGGALDQFYGARLALAYLY